jgi:sulfate transport system permease protein
MGVEEMASRTLERRQRGSTFSLESDPKWVRWPLIGAALSVLTLLILVPVMQVFVQALSEGPGVYWKTLVADAATRHALGLTLGVAGIAVAANTVFGLAAAWVLARFRFPGRTLLITLLDLPFSVSPVVAGMAFLLLFGAQGYLGSWLQAHGIAIAFAPGGLILATAFVTVPFIARELLPLLEALGPEEELAALSLGASGGQMFWRVTIPQLKWGLLYALLPCTARALGEYGAVAVVSGHITGRTETLTLRIERFFQEYHLPAAFAVASLFTLLALATLMLRVFLEKKLPYHSTTVSRSKSAGGVLATPEISPWTGNGRKITI